jgi:tRNA(Ile)-lysidine synthase
MPGPDPAVAAVRRAVRQSLAGLPPGALVVAACSGGADSVALLAGLAWEAPRAGLRAGVAHIDHGLAPDSAAQAARVAELGKALGVDTVETVRVTVDAPPGGPGVEAAAREARYAALADLPSAPAVVLLGHTLDDQAETVLLGLARGSGARSLAGMPAERGSLRRPLLGLRRADTLACCAALELPAWHDPSNDDPRFARNRVRAVVLPALEEQLGPGIAEALARSAELLRADADALDAIADTAYAAALAPEQPPAGVVLQTDVLAALPDAVRSRVLHRAARAAGVPGGALAAVHIRAMDELVTGWKGQGAAYLPGGLAVTRRYATLLLTPDAGPWSSP